MGYSIFYSWQSDSPAETNRNFIRKALDAAVDLASADAAVVDSPRVEAGMDGVSGTPEVATILFERIRNCGIFVADMTLVGGTGPKRDKPVPNPNVLLEMGYAAGTIGWGRIICVMNEEFGERAKLPFDVRNRRFPINYSLGLAAVGKAQEKKKNAKLAEVLKAAIQTVEANECESVRRAIARLDVKCLVQMGLYGGSEYFSAPPELETSKFDAAISRLMDLGLLEIHVHPDVPQLGAHAYAYHWTYLGVKVLTELKLRRIVQVQPPQQPPVG